MSKEEKKQTRRPFVSTRRANGPYIRYLREEAGLTLLDLEAASGVSYTQISRIETGTSRSPRTSTLRALAGPLGADYKDLVIHDRPPDLSDGPGQTEENAGKLSAKRGEWDADDAERRGGNSADDARGGD